MWLLGGVRSDPKACSNRWPQQDARSITQWVSSRHWSWTSQLRSLLPGEVCCMTRQQVDPILKV
jgi:hypothetical protein